ncbi:spermidine synthase [Nocardioides solisilvae]|uniref:spermidine synthase n=1 Tax=Nocardioides solisilvae TaxID=1542435 RepID=UPI001EF40361|nr:fused MFS/spermidine synthase [Nocardioides solisilvae]
MEEPLGGAAIVPTERRSALVLRLDGQAQSYVDLDDPGFLAFDYVRRLGDALDAVAEPGRPVRVVHVGGAGLTLPRYVAHTRPRSAQVVLEPDEELTALVRRELPLPPRSGIKVRPLDGRTGLAGLREGAVDVVLVDAFAQGRVPGDLVTVEAFAEVARVLAPDGLLLLNLADRAPFVWTRRVLAALRTVLGAASVHLEPATQRGRRAGNVLVVASTRAEVVDRVTAFVRSRPSEFRSVEGARVADSFGGGRPFTDADTEPSPRPDPA